MEFLYLAGLVKESHLTEHWKSKSSERWSWPTVEATFQLKTGSSNIVHIDSDLKILSSHH